ncbi:hypothetical protein G6F46_003926 [Rhizopus delemar]|uniref:Uncharacterized protein n=2 Tax=Rhizopus TaxID=4842 RepID=A0A9P6Z7L3_9FUNG|nr:hypothetical protein G6F43_009317 [Rhizopus delemar]KAG1547619.1 hypothetical protein G6F51_004158 [Rhizopus arrhizus]KAG1462898.1 hypothetical protein G6F55_002700 [Rhizopus delemar]KAG1503624.1 hypothetical protein G6F54_001550 [Rhizopus delemar]KAG1514629.1 hypothetical protein G6F53_003533 [Rhizopus delemar]
MDEVTIPSLSEFVEVFGSIEGTIPNRKSTKPLCDNIFDVQRNELFDVLESLKTAFWSDPVDIPSSEPVAIDLPPAAEPVILDLPLSTSTELAEDKAIEAKKDLLLPVVYKRRIPDWNENDTLSSQQSEPSYKRPRLSKSEAYADNTI